MEMLHGTTVESLMRANHGVLSSAAAIAIAVRLLDVLEAAHEQGIVHRDIKPANLFVTTDGDLKVLDFGIARLRDATSSTETSTGAILGTPAFASPEQAQGQTSEIGPATDVWAVGATLFAMLSGEFVYRGENSQQMLVRAATKEPRSIATVAASLPAEIASAIDRALAFRRQDRWPSAGAMRGALRAAYVSSFGPLDERSILSALGPRSGPWAAANAPSGEQRVDTAVASNAPRIIFAAHSAEVSPVGATEAAPGGSTGLASVTDPPPREDDARTKKTRRGRAPWLGGFAVVVAVASVAFGLARGGAVVPFGTSADAEHPASRPAAA